MTDHNQLFRHRCPTTTVETSEASSPAKTSTVVQAVLTMSALLPIQKASSFQDQLDLQVDGIQCSTEQFQLQAQGRKLFGKWAGGKWVGSKAKQINKHDSTMDSGLSGAGDYDKLKVPREKFVEDFKEAREELIKLNNFSGSFPDDPYVIERFADVISMYKKLGKSALSSKIVEAEYTLDNFRSFVPRLNYANYSKLAGLNHAHNEMTKLVKMFNSCCSCEPLPLNETSPKQIAQNKSLNSKGK
jgi:hypothetical protein